MRSHFASTHTVQSVRVPGYMAEILTKWRSVSHELAYLLGRAPTVEDPRTPDPEEAIAQGDMLDRLSELLTLIDEREATILKLRYGLDSADGDAMTLKEISKIVGLTRERVRQIEQDALRKLYGVMGLD